MTQDAAVVDTTESEPESDAAALVTAQMPTRTLERVAARPDAAARPRISVVIPALNESESLPELTRGIVAALDGKETFEIIFVDDGSTDDSWKTMTDLSAADPRVRAVRLRKNFGKAMGLSAGFSRIRGDIVVMMDADLQDDPAELPKFIQTIEGGFDVVVGWKVKRLDPANRLILTRIFNATVRWVTGVKLHDMNCGFKAYRSEVVKTIPIYGDLFRFIPALAQWEGFRVTEVAVVHHPRKHGTSRYGLERILRGFFDLLSITFLTKYSRRPMHLFGFIGLVMAAVGFAIDLYLTVLWFLGHKIGDRPLLLFGSILIVLGIQFCSMGFIGEFLTYLSQKRQRFGDLPIREETAIAGEHTASDDVRS
ncbi:MAG TPA: glycosyltransferase family 2 protein [Polyangiaceae bacterium]|jgi:glycosyltransferase involved in cell wall biosynthesis|nr:glycosyltransferase family 2 protein [Polyangiaceae bacterium]